MTFAQRLTTHFSERIPVVKRRIFVRLPIRDTSWGLNTLAGFAAYPTPMQCLSWDLSSRLIYPRTLSLTSTYRKGFKNERRDTTTPPYVFMLSCLITRSDRYSFTSTAMNSLIKPKRRQNKYYWHWGVLQERISR